MEESINSLLVYSVFQYWHLSSISYSYNVSSDMSAKERVWLFGFFGYLENMVAVIFMEKDAVFIISLPVFRY